MVAVAGVGPDAMAAVAAMAHATRAAQKRALKLTDDSSVVEEVEWYSTGIPILRKYLPW